MRQELQQQAPCVPPRHSAERHWRLIEGRGSLRLEVALCRLGTQPKGIGDKFGFYGIGSDSSPVPPRHSAERHWRPFAEDFHHSPVADSAA